MGLSPEEKERFLRALREDAAFRGEVARLLGVSGVEASLAKLVDAVNGIANAVNSLINITNSVVGSLGELLKEIRVMRSDVNRLWEENNKIWEELKSLRESQNRLWEENNKIWSELKALRESSQRHEEELKALREENNRIWLELRALREDSERRWIENEKRWEENNKKWEEAYKRFEAIENELRTLREDNEKRWIENDKKWQETYKRFETIENELKLLREGNEKRWEEQFRFNRWMMSALMDIRNSLGGLYEYYTAGWIREWLKAKGFDCDVKVNVTLRVDGLREVDAICYDPLVVGEATVKLSSIEEADKEIEKLMANVKAAEELTGRKLYAAVLAVETLPDEVAQYLREKTRELGIILVLGREYTF